jgi:hypothetical protein
MSESGSGHGIRKQEIGVEDVWPQKAHPPEIRARYTKSPEGVAEFKKIGAAYPETAWDVQYDKFLLRTRTDGNSFSKQNYNELLSISRIRASNDREYLVYTMRETRHNAFGQSESQVRQNIGKYPICKTKKQVHIDLHGYQSFTEIPTGEEETGYSIPFEKETLTKLVQPNPRRDGKQTSFFVHDIGRGKNKITVSSFEDLRDGTIEDLTEYGVCIKSEKQASQIKLRQKRLKAELEAQEEIKDREFLRQQRSRSI